ncbi:glycosyltransferase family 4 protein [Iamia sp.]|uniref:glycosyltransferase family 4 protein n=1 Tax=Iamia sp. TaxID=2722710 RepID=UPI002CEC02FD|nr:glycosyltransferase family 4 protein [Iamia sp.]HXH57672.1 glycosyltransferase family 4 protein [Iamia sp.]
MRPRQAPDIPHRVLVVAPYPPVRDGIGAYAVQQVRNLRRAGHDVEVLSPVPSAAHHHAELRGPAGAATVARLGARFDRVIVHFHPDVVYHLPPTAGARVSTGLSYGLAFRRLRHVELRLHEIDHRWADPSDPTARASRFMLRGADLVTVHSGEQRDHLVDGFGMPVDRVRLVDHGADFTARTTADRERARSSLGIDGDEHVFLCIGFVQPHKGFDRAARAFAGLGSRGARLDIVGSARVTDQATRDHVTELRAIAAREPGVALHLGFVSDEMFDRWIVASDTVVLPYRHIWSSSVAERAALLDRPVIATRVGGLAHQVEAMAGAVLVDDNAGLARALGAAVGRAAETAPLAMWPVGTGDDTEGSTVNRGVIQAEIEARATAARGGVPSARTWSAGGATPALSASVRRVSPLRAAAPVSARPGVSVVKRLIHRVIAWELMPITDQVNRLQRATADALDRAEATGDVAPEAPTADQGGETRDRG